MRSTPAWAKELEAELAAGKTLVTFTAVSGNDSDSCSLTVRVRDAVPPRVYNCPSDFNVYLDEGQVKRQVSKVSLQSGAATCSESLVKCFLRVPQAIGLYCSFHATQELMLPK